MLVLHFAFKNKVTDLNANSTASHNQYINEGHWAHNYLSLALCTQITHKFGEKNYGQRALFTQWEHLAQTTSFQNISRNLNILPMLHFLEPLQAPCLDSETQTPLKHLTGPLKSLLQLWVPRQSCITQRTTAATAFKFAICEYSISCLT